MSNSLTQPGSKTPAARILGVCCDECISSLPAVWAAMNNPGTVPGGNDNMAMVLIDAKEDVNFLTVWKIFDNYFQDAVKHPFDLPNDLPHAPAVIWCVFEHMDCSPTFPPEEVTAIHRALVVRWSVGAD